MGGQETSLVTHLIVTHLNNIVFVAYLFIALSPLFGGLQPTQSSSVLHSPKFPKWLIFDWGTIKVFSLTPNIRLVILVYNQ